MPSCIASSFSHGDAFISSKPRAHDDLHVVAAEAPRACGSSPSRCCRRRARSRACRSASMWPNDTDDSQSMPMWMLRRRFLAAGDVEVAAARRAAADEDRVVALAPAAPSCESMRCAAAELDAEVEDVAGLLVDHLLGQAEARDLRADHAAGLRVAVEHGDLVAERREVARDGQRGRPGADAGDALAVRLRRALAAGARVMSSL